MNHDAAYKANALGPRNLAQAAEKMGSRLVHVSTDYVFSGRENGGIPQGRSLPARAHQRLRLHQADGGEL